MCILTHFDFNNWSLKKVRLKSVGFLFPLLSTLFIFIIIFIHYYFSFFIFTKYIQLIREKDHQGYHLRDCQSAPLSFDISYLTIIILGSESQLLTRNRKLVVSSSTIIDCNLVRSLKRKEWYQVILLESPVFFRSLTSLAGTSGVDSLP